MESNVKVEHQPSSKLEEDQSKKPSNKQRRTHAPSSSPTLHSHHPTLTPTITPTSKINNLHSMHPTHEKTKTPQVEELGGKTKPSKVGDDINPSPEPTSVEDNIDSSPEPTPVTVQKNLRGSYNLKDDVPDSSPVPSTLGLKDDIPEPSPVPDTSGLKDDIPEPSTAPSVSWSYNDQYNFTIQPTMIPENQFVLIGGDEPVPPPVPVNNSISEYHMQALIEQSSEYNTANQTYHSNPYIAYMFGSMMALLISVGIAFLYRKRFQYKRIPSGNKFDYQTYEIA